MIAAASLGVLPKHSAHRLRIVRHGSPLGRQALDRLGSAVRAAPAKEFQVLVLDGVGGAKELLEPLAGAGGKITDVLQIGLKWRAVGHGEDAIVAFSLATARLLDFEYADRSALQDDAGIGPGVVNDENVWRIAVRSRRRGDKAPVEGLAETGHQRLCQRQHAEIRIEIELAGASSGRLNDGMDVAVIVPSRKLEKVSHVMRSPPRRSCPPSGRPALPAASALR